MGPDWWLLAEPVRRADGPGRPSTNGDGRPSDSLPGSRTFGGSSCAMNDWPRTFSGCYTWPAASFCCGAYEMASNQIDEDTASSGAAADARPTTAATSRPKAVPACV